MKLGFAKTLLVLVGLLTMVGCRNSMKKSQELVMAVRGYNDAVRWNNPPGAAKQLPPKLRKAFLEERETLADELRISEYDIARLDFTDDDKHRAEVDIKWRWFLDREGIVHRTTTAQKWQMRGKFWYVIEEKHLRGEPMPGVEVDETVADEDDETEEVADSTLVKKANI